MPSDEIRRFRAEIDRVREAETRKEWFHHVADLTGKNEEVATRNLDRPFTAGARIDAVASITDVISKVHFELPERQLTPRAPFQASPLSYLNSFGRSWSLFAEANRLEWAEFGDPNSRYGGMEFWFRNVVVGEKALVTIEVTASTPQGTTGQIEVRSSNAAPRLFPITGYGDHTLDVLVQHDTAFACLVSIEAKAGTSYIAFKEATYNTI